MKEPSLTHERLKADVLNIKKAHEEAYAKCKLAAAAKPDEPEYKEILNIHEEIEKKYGEILLDINAQNDINLIRMEYSTLMNKQIENANTLLNMLIADFDNKPTKEELFKKIRKSRESIYDKLLSQIQANENIDCIYSEYKEVTEVRNRVDKTLSDATAQIKELDDVLRNMK